MKRKIMYLAFAIMFLISCNRQGDILDQKNQQLPFEKEEKEKVQIMKEFSKFLGVVLAEKQNREYLESLIRDRNDNSEAITVNALFRKSIPKEENELLQSSENNKRLLLANSFKKSVLKEFMNNIGEFESFKLDLKQEHLNSTNTTSLDSIYDNLADYFVQQDLDIYFPYSENFTLSEEGKITLTWDPMTDQETNSGYLITTKNSKENTTTIAKKELLPIDGITDDYAYTHPTLVVRPAGWIGRKISPIKIPILRRNNPPSWAHKGWQGFLTFNVDHTKIMDEDVLKVIVPRIRLMEHLGTVFTPTTITIVRSNAVLKTNSLGNLVKPIASESFHLLARHHIKRRDARHKRWVDLNFEWDNDWNMHESIHHLTFASHHTFAGALDVRGNVGLGYDEVTKKVVPNVDIKIKIAEGIRVGNNCRLRYNGEISRRSVLSQIVGDTGAGTFNDGGVHYSIRTAGPMQYYFKPYLTKIVNQ